MKLHLVKKTVYGNELIYPACTNSNVFAQMLNKRTFNLFEVQSMRKLGYTIEICGGHVEVLEPLQ